MSATVPALAAFWLSAFLAFRPLNWESVLLVAILCLALRLIVSAFAGKDR